MILATLCLALVSTAPPPDREMIRERASSTPGRPSGRSKSAARSSPATAPDGAAGERFRRFDFKMSAGGKRFMKLYSVDPDGKQTSLIWFRQDGRKTYLMRTFVDDAASIDNISIRNQTDTPEELKTAMISVLWMWTPRGVPLYVYLDEKSTLEFARYEDGQDVVVVRNEAKGIPLRFVLDPSHDYLPLEIGIADSVVKKTTRFRREQGIWLPAEGTETQFSDGRPKYYEGFVVEDVHVNRPIPDSTFGMPALNEGVVVLDDTTGKNVLKGGTEARVKLEAKHAKRQPSAGPTTPTNVAPRDPGTGYGIILLATVSFTVLVVALYLRFSQSRK